MNDRIPLDFGELLAQREQGVGDERLAEHRHELNRKVARIARRETRLRRIVIGLGVSWLCILLGLCGLFLSRGKTNSLSPALDGVPDLAVAVVMALILAVPIAFVVLSFVYFVHYRRQLQRGEFELLRRNLSDIERQLSELRRANEHE